MKSAAELPPGTVTTAGTDTAGLSVLSEMGRPSTGAMPVNVSVPVTEPTPPVVVATLRVSVSSRAGVISRPADLVTPSADAVIVAFLLAPLNAVVVTVKVTIEALAGTVTETGTDATESSLVSRTTKPPNTASPVSVAVPVTVEPPPDGT